MTAFFDWRGHHAVGIALSADTLYVPGMGTWPLAPRAIDEELWGALRDALAEVRVMRNRRPAGATPHANRLAVALLPPLTAFRVVQLPKLREADLTAVLTRTVTRYFPTVRDRQLIAAERVRSDATGRFDYAVAIASAAVLDDIERAARAAAWTVDAFVPAYAAWATAAATRVTGLHGTSRASKHGSHHAESHVAIVRPDGGVDVLETVQGIPIELRRLRADDPQTAELTAGAARLEEPNDAAARAAPRTTHLALETNAIAERRRAQQRKLRWMLAAAAVVLLALGMAGFAWRTTAQLHDVAAERKAIAPRVAAAQQLEASFNTVALPSQSLARVEEHGARWSTVITDLATALPPDAFIQSLRTANDTLVIEGAAQTGARVFQTVGASDLLTNVTPVGSIRRDVPVRPAQAQSDGQLEHFTLMARVAKAAPLVPPPAKGQRR
jgi:hypothetical protein